MQDAAANLIETFHSTRPDLQFDLAISLSAGITCQLCQRVDCFALYFVELIDWL